MNELCDQCHRAFYYCICEKFCSKEAKRREIAGLLVDEQRFIDHIRRTDPDRVLEVECAKADLRRVQAKLRELS